MPNAPARFCATCRTPHKGTCPRNKPFGGSAGRGRGGRPWQRKRKRIFTRDGYVCQTCKRAGRIKAVDLHGPNAGVCDHINPLMDGGDDDEDNLQCICKACDKAKTAKEAARGGGGG